MPPKKKKDDAEAPKKKPRKKKPVAKKEKVASAPPAAPARTASSTRSTKKSGGGGLFLFVVLIAILAVAGVYVFQQRQNQTVSSKLSELEDRFEKKLEHVEQEFEEELEEERQKIEEEKRQELRATREVYESESFGYTFEYPGTYEIIQVTVGEDIPQEEFAIFMRSTDTELYADSMEGGPNIGVFVYENAAEEPLLEWLVANENYSNVNESTELEEVEIDGLPGYAYEWSGLGAADAIAVALDEYVLLANGWYFSADDTELREDFASVVSSMQFE